MICVEDSVNRHLQDLYGLNPHIPHMAFQFPRLPPGRAHPMYKAFENPLKEKFSQDVSNMNPKLEDFKQMFQQHAAGLLSRNTSIIPPGHPLYTRQNSVETLQAENDKLLKENTELKKKLETESNSKKH